MGKKDDRGWDFLQPYNQGIQNNYIINLITRGHVQIGALYSRHEIYIITYFTSEPRTQASRAPIPTFY
jgi:hypothetical protein